MPIVGRTWREAGLDDSPARPTPSATTLAEMRAGYRRTRLTTYYESRGYWNDVFHPANRGVLFWNHQHDKPQEQPGRYLFPHTNRAFQKWVLEFRHVVYDEPRKA